MVDWIHSARYSPLVFPKRMKSGGKTCTCALAEAMRIRLNNRVSLVFMLGIVDIPKPREAGGGMKTENAGLFLSFPQISSSYLCLLILLVC